MRLIETCSGFDIDEILANHHDFEYSEDNGLNYKPVRRDSFLFLALKGNLLVRRSEEWEFKNIWKQQQNEN